MADNKPFIYDYKKHQNNQLTIEQLDGIATIVLSSKSSYIQSIVATFKLALILAWLIARKILIDHDLLIAKQIYEQRRNEDNQHQVDEELR
jgi:hypothetical protein